MADQPTCGVGVNRTAVVVMFSTFSLNKDEWAFGELKPKNKRESVLLGIPRDPTSVFTSLLLSCQVSRLFYCHVTKRREIPVVLRYPLNCRVTDSG